MGGKDQHGPYEPGVDPRLDFILDFITRSLKIKLDKFTQMLLQDEYKTIVSEFFDHEEKPILVINFNVAGQLVSYNGFPSVTKTKSCYFMKKDPAIPLGKEDWSFKENLLYGDLAHQPLENLVIFIEDIISPLITAEVNHDKWPDTVVTDVKQRTQEICGALYSVQGQLKGKTLLPMPLNLDAIEDNEKRVLEGGPSEVDLQLKTNMETLVIKWSQQINEVLKQDSSKALLSGHHPTPYAELSFWEERVQDLQCIYDQLNEDKVRKIANILEQTNSTYWPCFKTMFRNVVAALAEAQDILVHLKPLKKHLDIVQNCLFDELRLHLRPMMHCICLIWGHSKYYCSAARIIILLQEICNMLIEITRSFLGGSSLFQMEPEEGLVKASLAVDALQYFRDLYDAHKSQLPVYFDSANDAKSWDFLPHLVFKRYDKFLDRMKRLKSFFDTSVEFYKLERIEIGGDKGRFLSAKIAELYEEFMEFFQKLSKITYDCSDPEDDSFTKDDAVFEEKVDDIDQRLTAIITEAFDDCHTVESAFKLIITLGQLLDRPVLKKVFEPKYPEFVKMVEKDLNDIKEQFDDFITAFENPEDRIMLGYTLPPYSSSINWARDMIDRTQEHIDNLKTLELPIMEEEDTVLMLEKCDELSNILNEFQQKTFKDWKAKMEKEAASYDKDNLILREDESFITINFSHDLVCALKEVQHMKNAGFADIPTAVQQLYDRKQDFRYSLLRLDQIARSYNKVQAQSNGVELNLMESKLNQIDDILSVGEAKLTWADSKDQVLDFVNKLIEPIKTLESSLQKAQDNVVIIRKLVDSWLTHPLFERKEGRKDQLLSLDSHAMARKDKQYAELKEMNPKIKALLAENKGYLMDASSPSEVWDDYLTYIDGIIVEGLIKTVAISFGYLVDHTDVNLTPGPLMEVKMELVENELQFEPILDFSQSNSFFNLVEDILADITHQASLVDRVKVGELDYLSDIDNNDDLMDMRQEVEERVQLVINQAYEYTMKFESYAYLWEDDRKEFVNQFLKYGHQFTQEEIDAKAAGEEPVEQAPTLEQFKEVIDKFEDVYLEVEKFAEEVVFEKWFRLDMKPFRQSLLNTVKKWSLGFKQYLIDSVIGGLSDLEQFIQDAEKGLTQNLRDGDLKALISVMGYLNQVKDQQQTTTNMFETIKKYIELLKMYEYELPENVFVQLEELPQKWNNTKKLAIQVKHTVAPLQAQEVSSIRKKTSDFDAKQQAYREKFKGFSFFDKQSNLPYKEIDQTHFQILALEMEYEKICEAASLFEVHVPEPKALRQCRKELRLIKQLWDYVYIVESCITDWKTTQWLNINVGNMDLECKRMGKEVKMMDKDVKNWEIFNGLEGTIRNMISSLKSVAELQNPAIRDRHWQELMVATKVKFTMDESTTLSDLVGLNLHNFEDEVKNIVDKAVKERAMEKTLKELETTWSTLEYEFEIHPRTNTKLIKVSEELIEILKDSQLQLQNISATR